MISTVVHEFTHSYANPLVDQHLRDLEDAGRNLWPRVADRMRRQAYGNWETMMRETLVRACVIRYVNRYQGADAARKAISEEEARGFLWMSRLVPVLARYEQQRDTARTLEAWMPQVVSFFDGYSATFEKDQKALDARRPRIVSMTPANRSQNVDPNLTAIRIVFDRPMRDGSWAVVGGGPRYPETPGKASYDEARKVFTLPVKLKPDWSYEFWLNRDKFQAFVSEAGVPLESVHVTFNTAGASSPAKAEVR
jgi:hypothetical protein